MTEEDVLDVLELLPVWQLRTPLALPETKSIQHPSAVSATNPEDVDAIEAPPALVSVETEILETKLDSVYEKPLSLVAENTALNLQAPIQKSTQEFNQEFAQESLQVSVQETSEYLVDYYQVGDYVFLTAATTRSEDVMNLLQNMLRAMRLSLPPAQSMYLSEISTTEAKIVIAMGMMVSHALLGEHKAFASLRGKLHTLADKPVIVTYDAQYLLDNPQDKPQAWADLCLAMQTLHNLT